MLRVLPLRPACPAAGGQRGFSLVELVVTFALLSILFMVAAPAFSTWIGNSRVRSVTEALQNGVRLAQSEALRRNQDLVLTFTNDANPGLDPNAVAGGRNWAIQTVASPLIGNNTAEFVRAGVLTDIASSATIGAVLTGTPTEVLAICFNSNGRIQGPTAAAGTANCAAGAVTFTVAEPSSDRPLVILVSLGGQVRTCDPNRPALSATSPDGCP